MRLSCLAFMSIFLSFSLTAQDRPKIGLVLSGGGAKGLAHIGVLEVLDEIGLKPDYITGASMGSIIGALYSMGYTGDSIHKIAVSEQWDNLLSNQVPLSFLPPEEKSEYGQFNLELSYENKKLSTPNGLLDGHLLSLELSRLTWPVADKKKFTEFPIPFKCVAVNIENGKLEVLDSGNIVEAMRASMAIPSLFKPIEFNGKYLIDGGLLRNFPVSDVKEMGADIVIGVNVSSGTLPAKKLGSIPSVLFQSIFLAGNADYLKQKTHTDYLIEPGLENYSAADFAKVDFLIKIGRRQAEKMKPALILLKDSLEKIYPGKYTRKISLPPSKKFTFSSVEIFGLKKYQASYVISSLELKKGTVVNSELLHNNINQLVGGRNFRKISYELIPGKDSSDNKLNLYVVESSRYSAQLDINYNSLFKSAVILNLTARNIGLQNSRLTAAVNIGDNIRTKIAYKKYLGKRKLAQICVVYFFDQFDVPSQPGSGSILLYSKLEKMNQYGLGLHFNHRITNTIMLLSGVNKEFYSIKNLINYDENISYIQSNNYSVNTGILLNALNLINYPTKGWKVYFNASYNFNYKYRFVNNENKEVNADEISPSYLGNLQPSKEFQQVYVSISNYQKILKKTTLINNAYAGLTFNTPVTYSHFFKVGGLRENFTGNIPMAGMKEFAHRQSPFLMNNIVSWQPGIQQQILKSFYLIARGSFSVNAPEIGSMDFSATDALNSTQGAAITVAYNSPAGPLEFSVLKSNQFKDYMIYVNLGYNFFNR